jgi:hypothetical protein
MIMLALDNCCATEAVLSIGDDMNIRKRRRGEEVG